MMIKRLTQSAKLIKNFLSLTQNLSGFIILILAGFSTYLRFKKLTYQSLWLDELFSINLTLQFPSIGKIINYCRFNDVHPPFYYITLLIWEKIFGINEFSGRALSSIFGILGIIAIYFLGKEMFSKEIGIFAAAILSVNYFHLYYSQEVRMYSLLFLLTVLSFLFFVRLVKRPSNKNSLFYILFTVLLIYTHYFGLFVFVSQILFFIFTFIEQLKENNYVKKYILVITVIVLSYIPWLPTLLRTSKIKDFWIPKPSADFFVDYWKTFLGNEPFIVVLFTTLLLLYLIDRKRKICFEYHKLLLLSSIFIPLFVPYFLSFERSSSLTHRNAIVVLPSLILIFAKGIGYFIKKSERIFLFLIIFIFSLANIFYSNDFYNKITKQQWRETANFVIEMDPEKRYPVYAHPFFGIYFNNIFSSNREIKDINELQIIMDKIKSGENISGFWICEAHFFVDNAIHDFFNKNLIKILEKSYYQSKATLYASNIETKAILDTLYIDLTSISNFKIPLSKLKVNGQVEIKNDEGITMPWNVILETPPIFFLKGEYNLKIEARGASVDGIFSRLKIYIEGIPNENIIYLTDNFQNYEIAFKLLNDTRRKISIEFDNDAYRPEIGEDRNVWLKSIELIKVR
jgi:uncharacterized membrane protein